MSLDERYKVLYRGRQKEHAVASPQRAQALLDTIDEDTRWLLELGGFHLITLQQHGVDHLTQLLRRTAVIECATSDKLTPLTGRILANAFIDDSNARTRQSFDNAFVRLGGSTMRFGDQLDASEEHPGALAELASMCSNYADVAVVRTRQAESLETMLDDFRIPMINAGNGLEEHPTHALSDLYTLFKWRPDLVAPGGAVGPPLDMAILSTPAQSRNVSSLLLALTRFPWAINRIVVFGRAAQMFRPGQREMLEQAGLRIETDLELYPDRSLIGGIEDVLPEMDVVYADRTQRWNLSRQDMLATVAVLKPGALVLHPQVRDDTISENLDHSEHNGYFTQERNAVFARMAVFLAVLGVEI